MTVDDALWCFDEVRETPHIAYCCGLPVILTSRDGIRRIYCAECKRTIRELAGQWIVEDWGSKGIKADRPDLVKAATAAWHLCQSLLAVRDGATDELITGVSDALAAALRLPAKTQGAGDA